MHNANTGPAKSSRELLVTLDSIPVALPFGRRSLNSVRSYLESVALANQRLLGELLVDGQGVDLTLPLGDIAFHRVDAATVALTDAPVLLLSRAEHQVRQAASAVQGALTLVLINSPGTARELWWKLAAQLKEPVVTLSLLPENLCEHWCGTTFQKLRRWQLEQVAMLVNRVDMACDTGDTIQISDALEKNVLPWLQNLGEHIHLWRESILAGARHQAARDMA